MVPDADTRADYNCNGATKDFAVPWYFLEDSHLRVLLTAVADETYVPLTLGVDYSVTGAGNELGGSITTVATYSNAYRIGIIPDIPFDQTTELENGDKLPAASLERMVDKCVMLIRQLREQVNRAVRGSENSSATYELPPPSVGSALGWTSPTELGNVPNSAVDFAAAMANYTDPLKGTGMSGHGSGVAYGPDTAGGHINALEAYAAADKLQSQAATSFTTTGTAPTYVGTPTPAITSLAGKRFRVKVHSTAAGQPTLNISTLGAVNWMQRNASGALTPANLVAGGLYDVEYDGTQFVTLNALNPPGSVRGVARGLVCSCSGTDANYVIACEELSVYNSTTGDRRSLFSISLVLNTAGTGANGLDTGTLAVSTLYFVWIIYNPLTNDTKSLLSLSSSAPTLPSGYTYSALIGALKTDSSGNKYPYAQIQRGRSIQYKAGVGNMATLPVVGSGTGTNVACAIGGWVPTAKAISVRAILSTSGAAAYITANAVTSAADALMSTNTTSNNWTWEASIILESSNIYYTGGAATAVKISGYDMDL